jgi:hypothetical protein
MATNKILSLEPASRLHKRRQPIQQPFDHPSMQRNDDMIRDIATQFVQDAVFGSGRDHTRWWP